jgi:hypothetical protein
VPLLDARTMLYKTYLKLDNLVKGVVRSDTVCRRLMSVPGRGPNNRADLQGGARRPEPIQVVADGGSALRPHTSPVPVRGDR